MTFAPALPSKEREKHFPSHKKNAKKKNHRRPPPKKKKKTKALALAKAIQKLDHVTVSPLLPTGKKPVKTGGDVAFFAPPKKKVLPFQKPIKSGPMTLFPPPDLAPPKKKNKKGVSPPTKPRAKAESTPKKKKTKTETSRTSLPP